MARPTQYERPDEALTRDLTAVKAVIKHLTPRDRAGLIAWLLLYYHDDGSMFSQQIARRRRRVTIDDVEYWLTRVPKRSA
jgi:hypothetical protein